MDKVKKQVVVITGASAGVGRSITYAFAKEGASIALIARGKEKLESTLKEVKQLGGQGMIFPLDISDYEKLETAAELIEKELGLIDIWINNAMVTVLGEVKDLSPEEIKRVIEVNYLGSVNGILIANRFFSHRNKGHIIQIGSALAYISIPLQSAYCASKHAIHGFIQSYRIELKINKSKIKISEVHLPAVNTPQFEWMRNHMPAHPMPVPPIYNPDLIAKAVLYIAHHPRREMWVGGSAVKGILGGKVASWLAEWVLVKNGVKNQQTAIAPKTFQDNLWVPLNRDFGSKGIFTAMEINHSAQLWMDMHRCVVLVALAILMVILIYLFTNGIN